MAVIAERAGFLWRRFDVGRDGKTAYERHERKSRRLVICVGKVEEEVTSRRPAWKLTCMWEDGVCLGIKATTGKVIVGTRNGVEPTRTERWDRSNLEMIVAVPWRKNEDDAKMDGERLKGDVVEMEQDCKENLEMAEDVPAPRKCT